MARIVASHYSGSELLPPVAVLALRHIGLDAGEARQKGLIRKLKLGFQVHSQKPLPEVFQRDSPNSEIR